MIRALIRSAFFLLILYMPLQATMRWPISYTKSLRVKLVDYDSGKPISGAIVEVEWIKSALSLFDPINPTFEQVRIMSDDDGIIRIPSHLDFHLLSKFRSVTISISHPLYHQFNDLYYSDGEKMIHPSRKPRENTFIAELKLRSIANTYADLKCVASERPDGQYTEECNKKNNELGSDIHEAEQYFSEIRTKKILNFNIALIPDKQECIEVWQEVVGQVYFNSPYKPKWLQYVGANQ